MIWGSNSELARLLMHLQKVFGRKVRDASGFFHTSLLRGF
jgi:hypothetical protein